MLDAAREIRELRQRNEVLSAQVRIVELMGAAINCTPIYPSGGMSPCVAWQLEHEVAKATSAGLEEETQPEAGE